VDPMILVTEIEREPQPFPGVIEADRAGDQRAILPLDRRFTRSPDRADTDAPCVVLAEALAEVDRAERLFVAFVSTGDAADAALRCPLRHEVDGAADGTAPGRGPVGEGAGAPEHLDPLHQPGGDELPWQDAVEAVQGDVVGKQWKAADEIDFLEIA